MFASIVLTAHAVLLPFGMLSSPTRDCLLDRMTATTVDQVALERFAHVTTEYALLHRHFERAMMIQHVPWTEEGDMGGEELAVAIRAARPLVRLGTIFNADVAELLRFRLATAQWLLRYHTASGVGEPGLLPAAVAAPAVNDWWLLESEVEPRPELTRLLPALPGELEYRFVGRHLVLIDAHANLVVDVLANALPEE